MPVTIPDVRPTVATVVLELLQVPPVVAFDNVVVNPEHMDVRPVILEKGLTLTTIVIKQPAGSL